MVESITASPEVVRLRDTVESLPNMVDSLDICRTGLGAYKRADRDRAISFFDPTLELNPKDALPAMYEGTSSGKPGRGLVAQR